MLFQAYLKGNIPCHQWTSQILLLKSHWWNKNETKHGYELWTNIDYFSVLFRQSLWHFYGAHKSEKMNAFNKKILRFHRIMVLHKYDCGNHFQSPLILSGGCCSQGCHGFPMRLAVPLVWWLHLLQAPFLMLISVVDRFKLLLYKILFLPAIQVI